MLGDELRKAREGADLTQEKLAFETGISRAYISQLEHDHKSPTVETLFLLCRACGTKASDVIAAVEKAEAAKVQATTKALPMKDRARSKR